jgi:hypothetical protein
MSRGRYHLLITNTAFFSSADLILRRYNMAPAVEHLALREWRVGSAVRGPALGQRDCGDQAAGGALRTVHKRLYEVGCCRSAICSGGRHSSIRLSRITPLLPANNHVVEREPSDRQ